MITVKKENHSACCNVCETRNFNGQKDSIYFIKFENENGLNGMTVQLCERHLDELMDTLEDAALSKD